MMCKAYPKKHRKREKGCACMSVSEFERRGWGQELCSFFSFDLTVDIIFIWQLKALGIASLILTLTLGFINNLELMRTSYNLVLFRSRLRRSHHFQAYRSLSVAFLKPDHHPPAIIPSNSRFLLPGFNAHRHRSAYISFYFFLIVLLLSYLNSLFSSRFLYQG